MHINFIPISVTCEVESLFLIDRQLKRNLNFFEAGLQKIYDIKIAKYKVNTLTNIYINKIVCDY